MSTIKELNVNGGKRPIDADAERSHLSILRDVGGKWWGKMVSLHFGENGVASFSSCPSGR
jgi:hypothetical protein